MTDHLNYFEPYDRKEAHHEDQLTRAFIVLLRHVPMAHAAWLELVDRGHRANEGQGVPSLHDLPAPEFNTQRRDLPLEVERVVSVIQTDEHYFAEEDSTRSDRRQVLDGVVTYAPGLAVVMENKPSVANVWRGQLDVNLPDGVLHDPRVASVRWRDVLERFTNLLAAGHIRGSEALLVEDFLGFVERHFPRLQPFTNLGVCKGDRGRLERRCRAMLEDIAPGSVYYHRGWGWFVRLHEGQPATKAALLVAESDGSLRIVLELDPGDTMTQARVLYDKVDVDRIVELSKSGWTVLPNLHLSFMSSNLIWTNVTASLADYMRWWKERPAKISQVKRPDFEGFLDELIGEGFAAETDRPPLKQHFVDTTRQVMNVCPGITMRKIWSLEEAVTLDAQGKLLGMVRQFIINATAIWGGILPSD